MLFSAVTVPLLSSAPVRTPLISTVPTAWLLTVVTANVPFVLMFRLPPLATEPPLTVVVPVSTVKAAPGSLSTVPVMVVSPLAVKVPARFSRFALICAAVVPAPAVIVARLVMLSSSEVMVPSTSSVPVVLVMDPAVSEPASNTSTVPPPLSSAPLTSRMPCTSRRLSELLFRSPVMVALAVASTSITPWFALRTVSAVRLAVPSSWIRPALAPSLSLVIKPVAVTKEPVATLSVPSFSTLPPVAFTVLVLLTFITPLSVLRTFAPFSDVPFATSNTPSLMTSPVTVTVPVSRSTSPPFWFSKFVLTVRLPSMSRPPPLSLRSSPVMLAAVVPPPRSMVLALDTRVAVIAPWEVSVPELLRINVADSAPSSLTSMVEALLLSISPVTVSAAVPFTSRSPETMLRRSPVMVAVEPVLATIWPPSLMTRFADTPALPSRLMTPPELFAIRPVVAWRLPAVLMSIWPVFVTTEVVAPGPSAITVPSRFSVPVPVLLT